MRAQETARSSGTRHRLFLVAAALLFSTGGAAIKASSLSGWQVASLRSGIAAITLWVLLPGARRTRSMRRVPPPSAFAFAATLILFVTANKLTTSANAIFLQATGPLYMLFLGPYVLKERLRPVDGVVVSSIAIGAGLLFSGSGAAGGTATNPPLGNLLAALSGLTWALTLTGLRLQGRSDARSAASAEASDSGGVTVIWGNVIAFAAALPFAVPFGPFRIADVAVLLYLGIVQIGVAYLALTRGIRHVPGIESASILLVEPVLNPIWTWILHHEKPTPPGLAGGALIILANLGAAIWTARPIKIPAAQAGRQS